MSEGGEPTDTGTDTQGPAPGAASLGPDPDPGLESVDGAEVAEGAAASEPSAVSVPVSVESLLDDVERLTRERDEFLDGLRRTQADFENYRKRMMKQQADQAEHAASRLVEELLPVLDACDGAIQHGAADVEPVFGALLGALEKRGLERIDPVGEPFDPNHHDAVLHEPAEPTAGDGSGDGSGDGAGPGGDGDGTVVTDVLRRGYSWKGRVLRPAMVKVRG